MPELAEVKPKLTIKTPQARRRKVSLNDLVFALEKALQVDKRRRIRRLDAIKVEEAMTIPERKIDITEKIREIYSKVKNFLNIMA